ncbi:von Willebrand factor type A domain protein [Marinomonas aquimarina]|uniref:von Willebrand factor type A domain protein n=1 Tax=Marinomonas aquimarina TaxID=295068 RepID=A0A1A8TB94_9GAMM|nr:VWA domain-containing protein [Marinomonas aquimarina]SBS30217.1 von Willebrand factor type A domain protein [Marinomonas aquimarina]
MLDLQWPWALLLLPLPLLAWWFKKPHQNNATPVYWRHSTLLENAGHNGSTTQSKFALLLLCLAWLCLVTAISRPTWLGEATRIPPTGRDLLIALDLSGSMQISDMTLNDQPADRLSAAKEVLAQFIQARRGDRIGIIVFGSKAYLQAPLSYDLNTINQLVQESQIGFAGEQTAIGDAIGLGIKRLQDKAAEQKVLILMTDGANTAGRVSPLQAADIAAREGVTIHTIGIGAEQMTVQGFFGPKVINPSSDLDEPLLTNIAALTNGQFFRARSTHELRQVYEVLEQLEPTPSDDILQRPKTTLFHWLGLAAAALFGLALIATRRLRFNLRRPS